MPSRSESPSASFGQPSRPATGFDDRMLAEGVAAWESLEPHPSGDAQANDHARAIGGDFENRLIARASAMPNAARLHEAQRQVRSAMTLVGLACVLLALLAGAATARASIGVPRSEPVNIFHVLAATLGAQTLLLLAWIVLMCWPRSSGATMSIASLGGLMVRVGQWLARKIHPGRAYASAVAALSHAYMRGPLGRWTFSAISHGLWLAFNVGCLATLVFLLSTRQYAFAWETTILDERTYVPLTQMLASGPRLAGFATPTREQIAASQWCGEIGGSGANIEAGAAWSAFLTGAIVVYGFAPRLLLLAWSLGARRVARTRYRLDVDRPDFARLRSRLLPESQFLGVVDPAPHTSSAHTNDGAPRATTSHATSASPSPPAILGLELGSVTERASWPPALHGVRWNDLGMVDGRDDRRRAIESLARERPGHMVIVCDLMTTPDRGMRAFLADVAAIGSSNTVIVLSGGQRFRERIGQVHPADEQVQAVQRRLMDWRELANLAGVPAERIVEIDLDHLTQATRSKMLALLGQNPANEGGHQRRVEQAFEIVRRFAMATLDSDQAVDDRTLASAQVEIARLHGEGPQSWRTLLRVPSGVAGMKAEEWTGALAEGARRFADLLPDRLRRSPRWLAAGASAGALGCVAAAALISPVAIGALPIWSGLGAAIAAVIQTSAPAKADVAAKAPSVSTRLDQAIRSLTIFALVLELQGTGESHITRMLERTLAPDDTTSEFATLDSMQAIERWLSDVRHRFDLALAAEARS